MSEPAAGGDGSSPPDSQLEELRALLVGPQEQRLQKMQERLDGLSFSAAEVGRVLPTAISLQDQKPEAPLAQALVPVVEGALFTLVQKDRERIAGALYPVMGPAIRKSIAESLTGLVQSLNQALEHSLSLRGLSWRVEAMRTGVSFGEVVLRHNLLFRVEQIFLIHKTSGLPMQHLAGTEVVAQDSGLVSGMLTALQDFVRDSFTSPSNEGIDMLKVGELNVWIEHGPQAILAAVIRGSAPESLRPMLRAALETIHIRFAGTLANFSGDDSELADARPLLESCMATQYKPQESRPSFMLILIVLAILLAVGFLGVQAWQKARRWESFVNRLGEQHGIVIHAHGRHAGRYFVKGLRDPLAADPLPLLRESGVPAAQVDLIWEEYQAMYPEFILARARTALRPPANVALRLKGRTLVAEGRASHRWLAGVRRIASALPGVSGYEDGAVQDLDAQALATERAAIEKERLIFPPLGANLSPVMHETLERLAPHIKRLVVAATALDSLAQVHIIGQADAIGTSQQNLTLSQQRAEMVAEFLRTRSIPFPVLFPTGLGALRHPHPAEILNKAELENEHENDRRVMFRVELFSTSQDPEAVP